MSRLSGRAIGGRGRPGDRPRVDRVGRLVDQWHRLRGFVGRQNCEDPVALDMNASPTADPMKVTRLEGPAISPGTPRSERERASVRIDVAVDGQRIGLPFIRRLIGASRGASSVAQSCRPSMGAST